MSLSPNYTKLGENLAERCIHKCIKVSSKFEGNVFGSYVFDVILPHYIDTEPVPNSIVNIWFVSADDVTEFVNEMGNSLSVLSITQESQSTQPTQYYLVKYDIPVALINVFVSDFFPVTDSDTVPLVSFTGAGGVFGFSSYCDKSVPELIKSHMNKSVPEMTEYA